MRCVHDLTFLCFLVGFRLSWADFSAVDVSSVGDVASSTADSSTSALKPASSLTDGRVAVSEGSLERRPMPKKKLFMGGNRAAMGLPFESGVLVEGEAGLSFCLSADLKATSGPKVTGRDSGIAPAVLGLECCMGSSRAVCRERRPSRIDCGLAVPQLIVEDTLPDSE